MTRPALKAEDVTMLRDAADEGLFSDKFKGRRVCFTGTMSMSRSDIVTVLRTAGGVWAEKAVAGTHYLVVGDTGAHGMTKKIEAAMALDIEVLEEHEFAAMLLSVPVS